jgi:hypothetical protein
MGLRGIKVGPLHVGPLGPHISVMGLIPKPKKKRSKGGWL